MQIPWVGPHCNKYIDNLQILGPNSSGVHGKMAGRLCPGQRGGGKQRSRKLGEG